MRASWQRSFREQQRGEEAEVRQGSAAAVDSCPAASGRPASAGPTYRIIYNSDDALSDGELHVERRQGSVRAWYEQGARGDGEDEGGPAGEARSGGSFTVVLHDQEEEGEGGGDEDAEADGAQARGRLGGPAAAALRGQAGVSWEDNHLFDYLKGMQQAAGDAPQGMDSEEWARRMAALRQLLRERDGEVAELQRLLDEQGPALQDREIEVAQQAQHIAELERRIDELEGRIRLLLRQLETASGGRAGDMQEPLAPSARIHINSQLGQKRPLTASSAAAAFAPAAADSYFVQLPAQSYAEHQGCGFWQSVVESVQHHPRRWGMVAAALLLLLLIVLCAALVPAARRRAQRPAFLAAPVVAVAGSSWIDLAVRLDRPGLLTYMAFRQADLNTQVPGLGRTLMELIQEDGVQPRAVYDASAPAASLDPAGTPQAGLQQLAAACGWAPVQESSADGILPASRASLLSSAGAAAGACATGAASVPGRCARCPRLEDGTAYTLLLVAASRSGLGLSSVQVVNAATGAASVNFDSADPPYADNATSNSFDLHFKLTVPGTLHYAIAYDHLYAPFGASQVTFGQLTPPASAIVSADPAAFLGGLVASGSLDASTPGEWATVRFKPPCVAALCAQSLWGLQGSTSYRVFLVAVDQDGGTDPAPAEVTVSTAPATSAPALLPATQPGNVTDSGFGVQVSQEAAGGVYYLLAAANSGTAASGAGVAAGSWAQVDSLAMGGSRRRLAAAAASSATWAGGALQQEAGRWQRQLLQDAATPGSLVAPTCYPANRTCTLAASAAFAGTAGLAGSFAVVASGCLPVPAAGRTLVLPAFSGLQNNTLYHLLLATEDLGVPQQRHLAPPAIFAIRTVDLSAPKLACGFPLATNITATSFALSAMLTKPGASVFYVVLPASAAADRPPSALEVLRGTAAGGIAPAAAGNLTQWGSLPWEATPAAGSADPRKLWAAVGGLQNGGNYTAFFIVSSDSDVPVPGSPLAVVSGILLPATVAPTFTRLSGINASVDEQRGTFAVQLSAELDRPGQVFYSLYRNYSCITGGPSIADIVAGNPLPRSICACEDASYCARVTTGSYAVPAQGEAAVRSVGGDLSPLPFQSLRNATDAQLKCFLGGLGQATDTYNIYLVAGNALPTFTGLAPQCSSFTQAAAVASAAAAGGSVDVTCPAAPRFSCSQAQLRPDTQTLQSGALLTWRAGITSTTSSGANTSSSVTWQQPAGVSAAVRPAKVQLSLEGGAAPAFTRGPIFPPELRTGSSFGLQFALDKPALLIYAVFRPMPIDPSGAPQAPVLIATGRVPVFDAAVNASTGAISACPWAPGGPMLPQSQYYVTFVARDKYGRMDGLCPGQAAGAAPRVCTDLAYTSG